MTAAEEAEIKGLLEKALDEIEEERERNAKERLAWSVERQEHKDDHDFIKGEISWLRGAVEPMKKERDRFTWLGRLGITIFGAISAIAAFWWLCLQIFDSYRGK